jgi:hypothetical protein
MGAIQEECDFLLGMREDMNTVSAQCLESSEVKLIFSTETGGTCLDQLELRRTDEAYLNAVGAERIPDPTTAGDFCRRFDTPKILQLMQDINRARQTVWKQQPPEFFLRAIIEADGTMVEASGQYKAGIGMNYKKQ